MVSQPDGNGELRVAMVSHDLRAPINAIVLGVEMLRRRRLGTAEDLIVQRIHRAAKRMASLVDRVLDQAVLQRGAPSSSSAARSTWRSSAARPWRSSA